MSEIRELLDRHVTPLQRKVRAATLDQLAHELATREMEEGAPERLVAHVLCMKHIAEDKLAAAAAVEARWDSFTRRYFKRSDDRGRRQITEDYLAETVKNEAQRRADLAALDRFLDYDALHERYLIDRHHLLVAVELAITFIANAGIAALQNAAARKRTQLAREMFEAGGLESFLHQLLEAKTRWQIRRAALDGLNAFAAEARTRDRDALPLLRQRHLNVAVRIATDATDHPWVQGSAIRLVMTLQPALGFDVVGGRFLNPAANERDFLVRRQCVDMLGVEPEARGVELLRKLLAAHDPSEHVRQGLAEAFAQTGDVAELAQLAGLDALEPSHRVRATAIRALCRSQVDPAAVLGLVIRVLRRETHALPLAIACEDIQPMIDAGGAGEMTAPLVSALLGIASDPARTPAIQEIAASAAERVTRATTVEDRAWRDYLASVTRQITPGRSWSIKLSRLVELPELPSDPTFLGRILAELSRRDFPLSATRIGGRLVLWRGDRYRRRLWRILHELRSPRPNKRQAHRHTVGRSQRGHLRAPPGMLDEVTATVVPGERVFVAEEGGWGRHVPTVDDLLDLPVVTGDAVRIFSSFGVTTVKPPRSILARIRNKLLLSARYATFAAMRLAALAGTEPHARQRYAEELRARYGIEISFERYTYPHARALAPVRVLQLLAPPSFDELVEHAVEQAS
ncbi:MAG: HEAT repeat domain-containing protein [Myxococcota bacterium]|nr:HEAT repeat domain-containing protein [Myxococcota bacterium]